MHKKNMRSKSKKKKIPIVEKSNDAKQLSPEQLVLVLENLLDVPKVHWRTVAQVGADYDIESAANADVAHRYVLQIQYTKYEVQSMLLN